MRFSLNTPTLALRQFSVELTGTFLLVLLGDGSIAQYQLLDRTSRDFASVAWGYGLAMAFAVLCSRKLSGAHLNPAVTLAQAVFGRCQWMQVPVYMCAQYLGALLTSAVVFGVYAAGINFEWGRADHFHLSSAKIFATYPEGSHLPVASLVFDQFVATAVFLLVYMTINGRRFLSPQSDLVPLYHGLAYTALHLSFAYNAGCGINPARDFAPRLLTLMAGFGVETFRHQSYFFWIPWIVPHFGALFGTAVFYGLIGWCHEMDEKEKRQKEEAEANNEDKSGQLSEAQKKARLHAMELEYRKRKMRQKQRKPRTILV